MYFNNIRTTLIRFSITAVLVMATAAAASAQSGEDIRSATEDDTTGNRDRRLAETEAARGAKPATGWLILDGSLMPGPYEVTVRDSFVLVNDLIVFGLKQSTQESKIDTGTTAIHRLSNRMLENFRVQYADSGIAVARRNALDFMRRQPIVDTAYFVSESNLRVRFKGEKYDEGYLLQPPRTTAQSRPERLRKVAEFFGDRLKVQLKSGGLVIMENGRYHTIHYPKSQTALNGLREIADAIVDLEERIIAVRKVIGKEWPARKIGERFMRK